MTEMQIRNLFSLEGKTALVTGGCYGIGFAIARALHAAGARVAFCATSDASVEKALASYAAEGITDVRDITINGKAENLLLDEDAVPVLDPEQCVLTVGS